MTERSKAIAKAFFLCNAGSSIPEPSVQAKIDPFSQASKDYQNTNFKRAELHLWGMAKWGAGAFLMAQFLPADYSLWTIAPLVPLVLHGGKGMITLSRNLSINANYISGRNRLG